MVTQIFIGVCYVMKRGICLILSFVIICTMCCSCGSGDANKIKEYLDKNWEDSFVFESYESKVLTVGKTSTLTYDEVVIMGSQVFTDLLSPAKQTLILSVISDSLDIQLKIKDVKVALNTYSSDGALIYTIDKNGKIWTCW